MGAYEPARYPFLHILLAAGRKRVVLKALEPG